MSNIIINNTQLDEKIESKIIENGSIKVKEEEETARDEKEEQANDNFLENVQGYVDETITEKQNELVRKAAKEIWKGTGPVE